MNITPDCYIARGNWGSVVGMFADEHFLFFPVIVIIGLILIVLTFKLIARVFFIILIIIAVWYGLYHFGLTSTHPLEEQKKDTTIHREKDAYAQV